MEFQVTGSPKAYRNAYGLCVDQYIPLGGGYVINVTTMKRYGGALATTAKVERRLSDETSVFEPFSDWSKTYISTRVRCTAKAVEAQAAEGLAWPWLMPWTFTTGTSAAAKSTSPLSRAWQARSRTVVATLGWRPREAAKSCGSCNEPKTA